MSVMTSRPEISAAISDLRRELKGRVIAPDDPLYDEYRTLMPGGFDPRPAVITRPVNTADVQRVVALARAHGIELAVRSGGHSNAGHGTTDDGIVIDLRDLTAIEIDHHAQEAWAETGLTALQVSLATAAHGLAVGFGDTGSVGIGGITTGGGVGYLGRRWGLTIDSVLAADVVTADGELHRVDAEHEPDLFWAIRGGGGNFGVATRFRYALHEVPAFTGGMLFLPASVDTVAGFIAAAEAASDELSTIANVMPAPPMPFLPEEAVGQLAIMAFLAYAGAPGEAEVAVAPFRALATPLTDMVAPISYPEIYPPEDESYHPLAVAHTMFVERVDDGVAATIMDHLHASDSPMRVAQLRVLGGAIARVPAAATAYAHRKRRIMVNLAAFYEGPDDKPIRERWLAEFAAAMNQGDDSAYVNFLGDEGPERVRDAYPGPTWHRLREIKGRYDPGNVFHRNQNIPPPDTP